MMDKAKAGGEAAQRISAMRWHAPAALLAVGGGVAVGALGFYLFAGLPEMYLFIGLGFMGLCYGTAALLALSNS